MRRDLDADQAHTIDIVVQDLIDRESKIPERTRAACERAAAELADRTGLFLLNKDLVDISPLATLDRLEFLHLSYNEIVDVAPLAKLTELRVLDLEGNRVRDARPLANLAHLESLVLDQNPIEHAIVPKATPNPPVAKFERKDPERVVLEGRHRHRHHQHDDYGWYDHPYYSYGIYYDADHHQHHHGHYDDDWLLTWLGIGLFFTAIAH